MSDYLDRLSRNLGYANYEDYLNGEHWKEFVADVRQDYCYCCDRFLSLRVHHITYERLGHEEPDDVVTVCKSCHDSIHQLVKNGTPLAEAHETRLRRMQFLFDLLRLPTPSRECRLGKKTTIQDRRNPTQKIRVIFPCRCWKCYPCAQYLRRTIGLHIGGILLDYRGILFAHNFSNDRWKAISIVFHRADSSWLRVADANGSMVIGNHPLKSHNSINIHDAVTRLGDALRRIVRPADAVKFQPVTSTADWFPPKWLSPNKKVRIAAR